MVTVVSTVVVFVLTTHSLARYQAHRNAIVLINFVMAIKNVPMAMMRTRERVVT